MNDLGERVLAWLTAVLLAYLFIYGITFMIIHQQCLSNGWANASVDYKLNGYCAREENEYEIIRPLEDILLGAQE